MTWVVNGTGLRLLRGCGTFSNVIGRTVASLGCASEITRETMF